MAHIHPISGMSSLLFERSHDMIIQDICLSCSQNDRFVSESIANFAMSNVIVNPVNEFIGKPMTPSLLWSLKKETIDLIKSKSGLELILFNAQAYYTCDFGGDENIINEYTKLIALSAEPLLKVVVRSSPSNKDAIDRIYRHLVYINVILSGLGEPKKEETLRKTEAVLQSILPPKVLKSILGASATTSLAFIKNILGIATGIRIYNSARLNWTSEVDNIVDIALASYSQLTPVIEEASERLLSKIKGLEYWSLLSLQFIYEDSSNDLKLLLKDSKFKYARNLLKLWNQIYLYMRQIKNHVVKRREGLEKTFEIYSKEVKQLISDLTGIAAIQSKLVYPRFLSLSNHYSVFKHSVVLFNVYFTLLQKMVDFSKIPNLPKSIVRAISSYDPEMEEPLGPILEEQLHQGRVVFITKDSPIIYDLQCGGFCIMSFLHSRGLVVNASLNIGTLLYGNKYYGFRTPDLAYQFSENPEKYVLQMYEYALRNPEYIEIFQLRYDLNEYLQLFSTTMLESERVLLTVQKDAAVETELHPKKKYYDPRYKNNIWLLKKEACQLADIARCKTHSTQTRFTHFKYGVGSQTTNPKETACQTNKDKGTSVPILKNFIYGLRGRRDDKQAAFSLTRPIDEEPNEAVICFDALNDGTKATQTN